MNARLDYSLVKEIATRVAKRLSCEVFYCVEHNEFGGGWRMIFKLGQEEYSYGQLYTPLEQRSIDDLTSDIEKHIYLQFIRRK